MKIQARLRGAVAPIAISVALASQPAIAQDDDDEAPVSVITEEDLRSSSSGNDAIVVTGSRLRVSEFNSPDPITIIDPTLAQSQGLFSTAEMVQSTSIASGSNQITSAISSNFVTNGGPGAETISLRGLGAERTLVLLNGRRAGPAGTRGGVSAFDLNVLPQAIVQSVELLKTGASSVYGSDAIAGVVNLITKKNTDGIELNAFTSIPQSSGGEQFQFSATYGKDFGNGHLLMSFDFFRREELKRRDREYLDCPEAYIFDAATGERADLIDPRTGSYKCSQFAWGHNWVYTLGFSQFGRLQYDYDGSLAAILGDYQDGFPQNFINPNTSAPFPTFIWPEGFYRVSYNNYPTAASELTDEYRRLLASIDNLYHPAIAASTVVPETKRYTAYVDAAYEFAPGFEMGVELLYNRRQTSTVSAGQFYYLTGYTNDDHPYNTDPYIPGWEGPYWMSPTPITDHRGAAQQVDYYRALAYVNGNFGIGDWNWDIWSQYSRSDGDYQNDVIYRDAINQVFNLRTSSCVGTTTPISGRPCHDINWLDPRFLYGDLNEEERETLYGIDYGNTLYTQLIVEAAASGTIIDLPAGPVQAAIGAVWRRDEINDTPGIEQRRNNNFGVSAAGITAGHTVTKEAFGEIRIPLIYNTPGIQSFTLSASARVTNVDFFQPSTGTEAATKGNWTYSVGANWEVTDWLRFRARYGTSFRAPALFELFLADQTSGITNRSVDICIGHEQAVINEQIPAYVSANCAAGIPSLGIPGVPGTLTSGGVQGIAITGGGIGVLEPETSTAKSASIILTPKFNFLPSTDISVALDYFDIKIKGEIATLTPAAIVSGCYTSEFFPNEPLCAFLTRRPPGSSSEYNLATVRASFININSQRNEGVDLTVNVKQDLGRFGTLTFLGQMTWQILDEIEVFGGTLQDRNGRSGDPKWTGDFRFMWAPDDKLTVFYSLNVVGRTSDEEAYIVRNTAGTGVCPTSAVYGNYCLDLIGEKKFYHSLSVSRKFGNFQLSAGVTNLFNTKPPRVTTGQGASLNFGLVNTVGQSLFTSQYDILGRRFFASVKADF